MSTKFDQRDDPSVVRNYGALMIELCAVVPDGVVCFFTRCLCCSANGRIGVVVVGGIGGGGVAVVPHSSQDLGTVSCGVTVFYVDWLFLFVASA